MFKTSVYYLSKFLVEMFVCDAFSIDVWYRNVCEKDVLSVCGHFRIVIRKANSALLGSCMIKVLLRALVKSISIAQNAPRLSR